MKHFNKKVFSTLCLTCLMAFCSSGAMAQDDKKDSLQLLKDEVGELRSQLDEIAENEKYEKIWKRRKSWKIGLNKFDIERTDGMPMGWETDFSIHLQRSKTAYFHSKPIAGMIKFGLDYGFMNIDYSKLKLTSVGIAGTSSSTPGTGESSGSVGGFDEIVSEDPSGNVLSMLGMDLGLHKFEYAMRVGPNISVNPYDHIIISAYYHLLPTSSCIIENDTFSYGFGLPMVAGVSVSYKVISVGVEYNWSNIKYKQTSFEEDDSEEDDEESGSIFGTTEKFKLKQKGPRFYIAFRF